jgi:regulator of sigma D
MSDLRLLATTEQILSDVKEVVTERKQLADAIVRMCRDGYENCFTPGERELAFAVAGK